MLSVLSGGAATLRFLAGIREILHDSEISVIVPTSGAGREWGGHTFCDFDDALFLFAGTLDLSRWSGIRSDTFAGHRQLLRLGQDETPVGDRTRALRLARASLIEEGMTMSGASEYLCRAYGIEANILPVSDEEARGCITCDSEPYDLFSYLHGEFDEKKCTGVELYNDPPPAATRKVRKTIERSDAVIIGPGRPLSAIVPMLSCRGLKESLSSVPVIAFAPFTQERAHGKVRQDETHLMAECRLYQSVASHIIQDYNDPWSIEGSIRCDTRTGSKRHRESLSWDILALVRNLSK